MRAMKPRMKQTALAAALLVLGTIAQAQISTATLKGQVVTASGQKLKAGEAVVAVNRDNGNRFRAQVAADGSYVFSGLPPGRYALRLESGQSSENAVVELEVGQTASFNLKQDDAVQTVTIVGSAQRQGVVDSQVGTFVSRRMIEALPQATRNFMSSADLAPGVRFDTDSGGNTRFRSGAADANAVNVYIDGVGQKNNILNGGINGQDSSRGNPFPQSAIAEYRVLTQNYKAEFDQLSSAAITAVTKSGTNKLSGEVYYGATGNSLRAYSPLEQTNRQKGIDRPGFSQSEQGFSLGGPIKLDETHFFVAYDGKDIDTPKQLVAQRLNRYSGTPGVLATIVANQGQFVQKFREHLIFGKLTHQIDGSNHAEVSTKIRRETGYLLEHSDGMASASTAKNNRNEETRIDAKYTHDRGRWFNEFRVGYENVRWAPSSDSTDPLVKYKTAGPTGTITGSEDIFWMGGSPDRQDRRQRGLYFKDDLTWKAWPGHVVKGGVQLKLMNYSLGGTANGVDTVETVINSMGQPYYNNGKCLDGSFNPTADDVSGGYCKISRGSSPFTVNMRNNQFGVYIQDDWAYTKQLEINAGIRWDYESNMLNNRYVTPGDRVAALLGPDTRTYPGQTAAPGQTYAQSVALGGVNIQDFISTGNRKPFKGAFAPRLGASYDVFEDKSRVIFGGWGRSYDRTVANRALDEAQKNLSPGGEIWMIRNDYKMPYSDQFSLGLRQAVKDWNLEATVSSVFGHNQFQWYGGNRDLKGGYATQPIIDPLWGGPPGFGTLILGDFVGENRTDSLFFKAEKPYTRKSGWGMTVAYTLAHATTTHKEWKTSEMFDWTYGRPGRTWNSSIEAEKHRLIVAGVTDSLLPWGLMLSGKLSLGSGLPRRTTDCQAGWDKCVYLKEIGDPFRQLDLGIAKDVKVAEGTFRFRGDVLNVLNRANWGSYNDWVGAPGEPRNPDLGKRTGLRGDMRTVRLTASYLF